MKKAALFVSFVLVSFIVYTPCHAESHQLADQYWDKAEQLKSQGRFEEAAEMYEKSSEAEMETQKPRGRCLSEEFNSAAQMYQLMRRYREAMYKFELALQVDKKIGKKEYIADDLANLGGLYQAWGRYDDAVKHYKKALSIDKKLGRQDHVSRGFNSLGLVYQTCGKYDKAIKYYKKALAVDRKTGRDDFVAIRLNNIGAVYNSLGQYDEAISHYDEALLICKTLDGAGQILITTLNNLGITCHALGQYDRALKNHEQSLAMGRKLGIPSEIARSLNNIGGVYHSWGQYDKAISHYEEALAIDRQLGRDSEVAAHLFNIGSVYQVRGQYDKAMGYYEKALAMGRRLNRDDYVSESLNSIGMIYHSWGQYDKAIRNYEEALAISRKLGRDGDIAIRLNSIGWVYHSRGQNDKAITYFEKALAISRKLGKKADIANSYYNMGVVHYLMKHYDEAVHHLNKSVELTETLRKTATGTARRDYLASQIQTYQFLVYSYFQKNELAKAFETIELSRAKLLGESLAESKSGLDIPSARHIQRKLSKDAAIIIYANENMPDKIVLVMTKDTLSGVLINDAELIASVKNSHERSITRYLENQRGIRINHRINEPNKSVDLGPVPFAGVIAYYRSLLTDLGSQTNRGLNAAGKPDTGGPKGLDLNQSLYDFLIKPVETHIRGKKTLLIIPDGYLGFLPFETLVDDKGQYLVENYNICYSQSMGVSDLVSKRKYKAGRKPLLALGGASYNPFSYDADMIQTDKQLEHLKKELSDSFREERSVRNAYASLDLARWNNLPGTLSEVENIGKLVSGARVVTGDQVTEHVVKQLSNTGDLADYQVIHFATHGLVVPEMPELSAIVLSQFKNEQDGEDGYLRMGEIEKLKINADLVTLSACETGLGKIYGGEGVVGLTQSFLIAGANGLSVSLWQVADLSTSKFMVSMYGLVEQENTGFDQTINEIKRKFIRGDFGDDYRAPYYWAPFVYYGNSGAYGTAHTK